MCLEGILRLSTKSKRKTSPCKHNLITDITHMSDHPHAHISHDGLLLLIRGTVKVTPFWWISYSTTLKGSWPGRLIIIFPASKPPITKRAKHHGSTHFRRRTLNSSRAFCRPLPTDFEVKLLDAYETDSSALVILYPGDSLLLLSVYSVHLRLALTTIYYTTTSVQQLQQPPCLSLLLPSVRSTGIMLASKSVKVCNAFLYCSLLVQDANHSKSTDMITLEPWARLLNLELKVMGIIIGPNLLNLPTPSHEKKQIEREQSSARCVTNKKSINTTKTP